MSSEVIRGSFTATGSALRSCSSYRRDTSVAPLLPSTRVAGRSRTTTLLLATNSRTGRVRSVRACPSAKETPYRLRIDSRAAEVSSVSARQYVSGTMTLRALGATEKVLGVRETSSPSMFTESRGSVWMRTREVLQ